MEEVPPESPEGKKHDDSYPPSDSNIKEMIHLMMAHKKLPGELPKTLLDHSRDVKSNQSFPRHLVPTELKCTKCRTQSLCDPRLVTKDAKILMFSGVIQGMYDYCSYINVLEYDKNMDMLDSCIYLLY